MPSEGEIEELEEDNVEIDIDTRFNLWWTCPNCNEDNAEYNITPGETVKCECEKCGRKYEFYYNPY